MPRHWEVSSGRRAFIVWPRPLRGSPSLAGFYYCVFPPMLANLLKSLTKVNKSLPISCTQSAPGTLYVRLSGHSLSRSRACSVIGNVVRRRTTMTGAGSFDPKQRDRHPFSSLPPSTVNSAKSPMFQLPAVSSGGLTAKCQNCSIKCSPAGPSIWSTISNRLPFTNSICPWYAKTPDSGTPRRRDRASASLTNSRNDTSGFCAQRNGPIGTA